MRSIVIALELTSSGALNEPNRSKMKSDMFRQRREFVVLREKERNSKRRWGKRESNKRSRFISLAEHNCSATFASPPLSYHSARVTHFQVKRPAFHFIRSPSNTDADCSGQSCQHASSNSFGNSMRKYLNGSSSLKFQRSHSKFVRLVHRGGTARTASAAWSCRLRAAAIAVGECDELAKANYRRPLTFSAHSQATF